MTETYETKLLNHHEEEEEVLLLEEEEEKIIEEDENDLLFYSRHSTHSAHLLSSSFSSSSSFELLSSSSSSELESSILSSNRFPGKRKKIEKVNYLKRKVKRLTNDNIQLKNCAQSLQSQHEHLLLQTLSKESLVEALEKRLAQSLLLLQQQNKSSI